MIKLGIIGYGYWGKNIVRNFVNNSTLCKVVRLCDTDAKKLQHVKTLYPFIDVTTDVNQITGASDIDAVVVVTPVSEHYQLVRASLLEDKHVFCEKPLTTSSKLGRKLLGLAEERNKVLMIDHTFLYSTPVQYIKSVLNEEKLGEVYYYDSYRANLGLIQPDVNVVWDLAPHDFSLLLYLFGEPVSVQGAGYSLFRNQEKIAFITINYNNMIAHFNFSWVSPVKIRRTIIGGTDNMLVWDDMLADDKIKLYNKGIDFETNSDNDIIRVGYRKGDMISPFLYEHEPLDRVAKEFLNSINNGTVPLSDGVHGLKVVEMLETVSKAMKTKKEVKFGL